MKKKLVFITTAAVIAALYVALTYICNALGLANGAIQLRFSEALCALCLFTPAAIPGLFAGCLLSNVLTGCALWDVVFGSVATLLGSLAAWLLRKMRFPKDFPVASLMMPVIANTLILPPVLKWCYPEDMAEMSVWFLVVTVFIGEFISCVVFGLILYKALDRAGFDRLFGRKDA